MRKKHERETILWEGWKGEWCKDHIWVLKDDCKNDPIDPLKEVMGDFKRTNEKDLNKRGYFRFEQIITVLEKMYSSTKAAFEDPQFKEKIIRYIMSEHRTT